MKSRNWAMTIKRLLAEFVVVFAIIATIAWFSRSDYSDDNPLAAGLIGIIAYFVISLIIASISGMGGLLYIWLDKGRDLQELILNDLRAMRLPAPREYHMKTMSYLAELAADSDESAEDRVKAASLSATVETIIRSNGLFGGLAWQRAADEAVLRYSQEAPTRR